ncbi:glycoside hydrolase family 5 protein [Moniliophthora roreri MCA 2997]|uniref:Glycoside hydrolase family 5 protein n=1 Tax=Moniliophthora roreri (strain MCA 2997) TaxID=1381753 RepID=V2X7Z8_MONRO|nr:glycoside hydrolase family 5 protein [Moniliophthora roreri MCA 2997]
MHQPSVKLAALTWLPAAALAASISSSPAQTILGIGGSGAWWVKDLFQFPEATRQNLSNLLFSQDGLGLSSYRWNVGGGGVGVNNPVRAPETFYLGPGNYNWSADSQGVYFLREAAKHDVHDLTMFANTAPAPLTAGGKSCGSSFVEGSGDAYATFLVDVLQHFRDEGININFVSPMNEPDNNFGDCGQEGMLVLPWQRPEVFNSLWNALNSKGLTNQVGILADESSWLIEAAAEYPFWLSQVADKLAAVVHHTYDFPSDAGYRAYIASTKLLYPSKPTWMTEICCGLGEADGSGRAYGGGYDPTIKNALMFSGLVFQSLIVGGESHYDFWTLVSSQIGCSPLNNPTCVNTPNSNGWTDGLIYYDGAHATNGNHELYITKHYWTYKHFGNFLKPGSQRHAITGDGATNNMIAVSTSSKYFIIAMNPTNSDTTLSITFPNNEDVCVIASYRTSATEDFGRDFAVNGAGSNWALPLKTMSLTTYEIDRKAC